MGIYTFSGELGFYCAVEKTYEFDAVKGVLKAVGMIPSELNSVLLNFRMDIEADNRPAAFTMLHERIEEANNRHLQAIGKSGTGTWLFIHQADTKNRYRGDLLYGYERQLAIWFNDDERANPDLIMNNVSGNSGTDEYRRARTRYLKLRRILGLQQFVLANPVLPLSHVDRHKALTRILIACPGLRELRATYSVLRQRVHLLNEDAGVNVYILPDDVHALELAMLQVEFSQPQPAHNMQTNDSHTAVTVIDEDIPF